MAVSSLSFAALRVQEVAVAEAVGTKTPAAAAVVADKSIAGGGAGEEVVDFWEVHNVAMKMTLRSHCADKSNLDALDCKELKPQTHRLLLRHYRYHCTPNFDYIDSLAAVIEEAEAELELELVLKLELELVEASDSTAQMTIAEGKACMRPWLIFKLFNLSNPKQ